MGHNYVGHNCIMIILDAIRRPRQWAVKSRVVMSGHRIYARAGILLPSARAVVLRRACRFGGAKKSTKKRCSDECAGQRRSCAPPVDCKCSHCSVVVIDSCIAAVDPGGRTARPSFFFCRFHRFDCLRRCRIPPWGCPPYSSAGLLGAAHARTQAHMHAHTHACSSEQTHQVLVAQRHTNVLQRHIFIIYLIKLLYYIVNMFEGTGCAAAR